VFFKGPRTVEERQASQAEERRIAQATVRAREVGPPLAFVLFGEGGRGSCYEVVPAPIEMSPCNGHTIWSLG